MLIFNQSAFKIALLTLSTIVSTIYAQGSLELVQIVFRHGDRAPTDPFPNDVNNVYWTDGFGQLTNIGKQQHLALGQYIRSRYTGFLNETYNHEEVLINSTDVDRTLMSAYCNLAGLYPPIGGEVWNENIAWQPIPVHTKPQEVDYIVDADADCPKYWQLFDAVKKSPELQQINADYADLYAFLTNETGYDVYDIFTTNKVYDALYCDRCHNLTVPQWALDLWDELYHIHNLKFLYEYGLPQLARLTSGPLLGHMIDNMNSKINGAIDKQKAFIFSSHDSKITAFLSTLNVWNGLVPSYASAVFVELYKMSDSSHGVQVSYYNDTTVDPYILDLPGCTSPCPLNSFINLTSNMVPENILEECFLIPSYSL